MTGTVTGERLFTRDLLLLWAMTLATFSSFQIFLPILPLHIISVGGTESQIGLIVGIVAL